jgi:hypothetical protein
LLGTSKVVASELHWRTSDPAAIHAVFNDPDAGNRPRVFARAILTAAMATGHGGEMDVTAARGGRGKTVTGKIMLVENRFGDKLWLYLSSPDGLVVLVTDAKEIDVFLNHTYAQVPNGHEADCYIDGFDEEVEALFSGE